MTSGTIMASAAGTWTLGDRPVRRLGFGSMRLTGSAVFHGGQPSDRNRSIRTLRRAVELGVNHIDTAAFYFSQRRSANELINSALAPYPDDVVIVTKVGPGRDPSGEWLPRATPEQLRGQVEENIRQLGLDQLEVVNLRVLGPDSIAEQFTALAALREAGLIRHLGISGVTTRQLAEAMAIAPVVCVQNRYAIGLHTPADDEVLHMCGEHGIAFVPYFAIAGDGKHNGSPTVDRDDITAIAQAHDATAAQVRLAWTLGLGPHVLAIPGTGDPDHVTENVAAAALRLTPEEMATLSR